MSKKLGNSKTIEDLQEAFKAVTSEVNVSELIEENKRLKELVKVLMDVTKNDFQRLDPLDEEYICEIEIAKIRNRVNNSNIELSLDDVKKLETLWKVKKSTKEYKLNQKSVNSNPVLPPNLSLDEVKQIAASDEDGEDNA